MKGKVRDLALTLVRKYHPDVEKVVDGLKNIRITVDEKDQKNSDPLSPNHCALAKACLRNYDGAIIGMHVAYMIKGKIATRYMVPTSVAREIVTFDRHKDFSSGIYQLGAPWPTRKLGSGRTGKKTGKGKKSKPQFRHVTKGVRKL